MKRTLTTLLIATSMFFIGCGRPQVQNNLSRYEGWVVISNHSTVFNNYLKIYKPLTDSVQEMLVDDFFTKKFQPNDTITFKK